MHPDNFGEFLKKALLFYLNSMKIKERLDLLLVLLNLTESRQQGQKLILSGLIKVNGQIIDKPGYLVSTKDQIEIIQRAPYVSRGGEKLAKALVLFPIQVKDRICLDAGISTGGFTDCLLQAGVKQVYGVDVGYGQVAWSLRQDSRVVLRERCNIRHLSLDNLYGQNDCADLAVADLSFISLEKVLPNLWNLLKPPREIILLVKPQFEVGKDRVGKKGVVRDPQDHNLAINQVNQSAIHLGWSYCGLTFSPLTGPAGNIEYFLHLKQQSQMPCLSIEKIQQVTTEAFCFLKR